MSEISIGSEVIASKSTVYGHGEIVGMVNKNKFRVKIIQGYFIDDGVIKNINNKHEILDQKQKDFFNEELAYMSSYEIKDEKEEEAAKFEEEFAYIHSSSLGENEGIVFSFKRSEILVLEEGTSAPRLIWNSFFTPEERLIV